MTLDQVMAAPTGVRAGQPLVAILRMGLAIPRSGADPRLLSFPDVRLLERLAAEPGGDPDVVVAAVAAETGADAEELRSLVVLARERVLPAEVMASDADAGAAASGASDAGAGWADDTKFVCWSPQLCVVGPSGFVFLDATGAVRATLSAAELDAAGRFVGTATRGEALGAHQSAAGEHALTPEAFEVTVARLVDVGVLREAPSDGSDNASKAEREFRIFFAREMELRAASEQRLRTHDAARAAQPLDHPQLRVIPVNSIPSQPPLALGTVVSHAVAHGGPEVNRAFDLSSHWAFNRSGIVERSDEPAIFLFSNYVWSHAKNLKLSATVREANPDSITIHGGPDTPKYEDDQREYFASHPHVDIIVRGEGEETFTELLRALAGPTLMGRRDLSVLADVAGLSYRTPTGFARTPDRDRLQDLDLIPSPFLNGWFDSYSDVGVLNVTIETNRGCPYGCTYCDWGSSTLSRIRKFSMERVFDELEWAAANGTHSIWVADANFGIMERDVEIAEKVAQLRLQYGYPRTFDTNYAKNSVKHVRKIVESMVQAGITTHGLLSLQSMDAPTLLTIRRSNIKTEKYDQLAVEFRKAELPLFVDLMLGLPGSTVSSFLDDLQQCIEREVYAKIFPTELLVNSPMNDPEYRREHQIVAQRPHGEDGPVQASRSFTERPLVVSTATFTRADWDHMMEVRRAYFLFENFGVLRHLSRFVRQELGLREVDFYRSLVIAGRDEPESYPLTSIVLEVVTELMVPPVSWSLFLDEVREHLVNRLGLADTSALDTAITVQRMTIPDPSASYPLSAELAHDIAAWQRQVIDRKAIDHDAWVDAVPHLSSFGPATFTVDDPSGLARRAVGFRVLDEYMANWELEAPIARQMPSSVDYVS